MTSSVKLRTKFHPKITIEQTQCSVCCECINVCREEVLGLVSGKVRTVKTDQCSYCEDCIDICENGAIKLQRGGL